MARAPTEFTRSRQRSPEVRGPDVGGERPPRSMDRLTRLAARLLDVPVAVLSLADADRHLTVGSVGYPFGAPEPEPLDTVPYCAHVMSSGQVVAVSDLRAERPEHLPPPSDPRLVAYLGVPVLDGAGTPIGSFCVVAPTPREWRECEIADLRDLAACVDTELALHEALSAARTYQREAEGAGEQLSLLAEASVALAESLGWRTTVETLGRIVVPRLADWALLDLISDGRVRRMALGGSDADLPALCRLTGYPPRPDAPSGIGAVLRTGEPLLVPLVDERLIDEVGQDEVHRAILRQLGVSSAAVIPLVARGRPLGALAFLARSALRYETEHMPLLEEIGRRAALALDNAELYSSANTIARTLQHSLLPPKLPTIEGIDLARHYRPSGTGAEVGGDFYDVFELPDGRWLAVIGDVVGKGPAAAAVTGLARHTLRAAAMHEAAPSRMLGTLNDVLLAEDADPDRIIATVAAAALETRPGGHLRCTISSGGHVPPLIRRRDGTIETIYVSGVVLGVMEGCPLEDVVVDLEPGDVLLLYTDGVTEARAADGSFMGGRGLRARLATAPADSSAALVAALGAEVDLFQGGRARDDVALLAFRVLPG